MAQFLQVLSVWRPWNTAFLVYSHRQNSHFMSQLLWYLSFCLQLMQYGVAPASAMDDCSLTPRFGAYCSFASWRWFCFCVSSHLSSISHSLLNCHPQPLLGLRTAFCYQHFCAFSFLAFMWKPLPRNACINLTPKPLLWHHVYKNSSAELDCLQRLLCATLACPILWYLPFLANCLWICFLLLYTLIVNVLVPVF